MVKILLMNPNSNARTTAQMCVIAGEVLRSLPLGWTAPSGPAMIVTPTELAAAGRLIETADLPAAIDGIIVSAFGDPGAAGLAARAPCPVIGIGAAAARAAAQRGLPFAVATTTPDLSGSIDMLMRGHAGLVPYIGCFTTTGDPEALMRDQGSLDAALLCAIETAAEAGAAQVIIGGGPLGQAARRLQATCPLPLLSPIICAAREMAVLTGACLDEC